MNGTEFTDLKNALCCDEFEPETWRDRALVPWGVVCWLFAWAISFPWYWLVNLNIWFKRHCWPVFFFTRWVLPLGGGRWVAPDPVICRRCFWAGMRRRCIHGYAPCGEDDIEPEDYCRRCGSEI